MARSTSRSSASQSLSPGIIGHPESVLSKSVCNLCRQRKVKCDRQRPVCSYCFKGAFQCEYSISNRKRGLRAGYVSELEKRVAKIEREFCLFKEERSNSIELNAHTENSPNTRCDQVNSLSLINSQLSAPHIQQNTGHPRADTNNVEIREPPHEILINLVEVWFKDYHPWHPLLHQPSLEEHLRFQGGSRDDNQSLIFKAITAVIIPSSYPDPNLSQEERVCWSKSLRDHVLFRGFSEVSFHGLQALLILAVLDYGNGDLSNFWNLIAICKRLSMQLGLRDMVVNYCLNYGKPSIIPPRMLSTPSTRIEYEERVRAFWITEILDSTSTLGVAWNFHIPHPEINVWTPCEDDMWTLPDGLIRMLPFGTSETPGSFSSYVRLVSNELWHVHNFLQQSCDMTIPEVCSRRQAQCQIIEQRLLKWQSEFDNIAQGSSPLISHSVGSSLGLSDNVVLTSCTLDAAIIVLHQRLILLPGPIEAATQVYFPAFSPCLQACNHLVTTLRTVEEEHFERMSPQLIACVFVAARFNIMYAKAMNTEIPPKLEFLKYVLKACGQRWPLARRLGKVLSAGTTEQGLWTYRAPLPEQFFDLQYSWPDIDDALQKWAFMA